MNPFQAPAETSNLSQDKISDEVLLPSRWRRLLAAIIDGIVMVALTIPLFIFKVFGLGVSWNDPGTLNFQVFTFIYSCVIYVLANYYFILKGRQTIGKYFLKLKISTAYYYQPSVINVVFLRTILPWCLYYLPMMSVGCLIGYCLIFLKNKRCLHDYIAGTSVVDVSMKYNE